MQQIEPLIDDLIYGECKFIASKNNDGGITLSKWENKELLRVLEKMIRIQREDLADIIRAELSTRLKRNDN